MNDQASLENACPESGGICVLGLLEAGSDSAASQIDILKVSRLASCQQLTSLSCRLCT